MTLARTPTPRTVRTPARVAGGARAVRRTLAAALALSLPAGTDARGMPVGVQLVADYAREDTLLRLSGQLEAAAPWPAVAPGYAGW